MAITLREMLEAADAAVPRLTQSEARDLIAKKRALVVDVRDPPEVEKTGRIAGAIQVSRGLLEFRADPQSPYHDSRFDASRPLIVYGAADGRSALAGQTLKALGYEQVFNLGAFDDWAAKGFEIEKPIEPGL